MHLKARPGMIGRTLLGAIVAAGLCSIVLQGATAEALPYSTRAADDKAAVKAPEKPAFEQLFQDWPQDDKPAFVVALTGEMSGYLRPCGCSEGQGGGLPRRAAALAYL